jgi:hypothetical protein
VRRAEADGAPTWSNDVLQGLQGHSSGICAGNAGAEVTPGGSGRWPNEVLQVSPGASSLPAQIPPEHVATVALRGL